MPAVDFQRVDEVKILQGAWYDKEHNLWTVKDYRAHVKLVTGGVQTHMFEVLAAGRVGLLGARIIGMEKDTVKWSDGDTWSSKREDDGSEIGRLHTIIAEKDAMIKDLRQQLSSVGLHQQLQPAPSFPATSVPRAEHPLGTRADRSTLVIPPRSYRVSSGRAVAASVPVLPPAPLVTEIDALPSPRGLEHPPTDLIHSQSLALPSQSVSVTSATRSLSLIEQRRMQMGLLNGK